MSFQDYVSRAGVDIFGHEDTFTDEVIAKYIKDQDVEPKDDDFKVTE